MSRVLFVLKRREDYSAAIHSHVGLSTGLYNSAKFMNDMLIDNDIESKMVVVADNNCIDAQVTAYKPTHVIIEALWVVPTKFSVLQKLHPGVTWIIRIHSEMPFMAGEGMAMDWIGDYSCSKNVVLACNAPRMLREVKGYLKLKNCWNDEEADEKVIYLPNFYPQSYSLKKFDKNKDTIDIGCFGAVRPLKNHLVQAFAAIEFAEKIGKKLRFHVNAGRIEMKGEPMINNLRGLFEQLSDQGHQLINHEWTPRAEFLQLCGKMDIGLQVSFSETFNIVGADLISQGVPIVGSCEIPWQVPVFAGIPTSSESIVDKLMLTYRFPRVNTWTNQFMLTYYTSKTRKIWLNYFNWR